MKIAVVGAGILGRLVALNLASRGLHVSVFDERDDGGSGSASSVAGGMLAPYCELETAELPIFELGLRSIAMWELLKRDFGLDFFFATRGSLVVAHALDQEELTRFETRLRQKVPHADWQRVDGARIGELEPFLKERFSRGLFFPAEGQIDAPGTMRELTHALKALGCRLRFHRKVSRLEAYRVDQESFDEVIDCRGIGARQDLPDLRAVRGEILWVKAQGLEPLLSRPVRLMHPRYPLYVIPRPEGVFGIGATAIESDDDSPLSVRSALELLSAATTLVPAFSEARILRMEVGLRPAFPTHLPKIERKAGLTRVNGLYRHGYLIGPAIAEETCALITAPKESHHDLVDQR